MDFTFRNNFAQTVNGPVAALNLGITLTHEHLHMQHGTAFLEPSRELKFPQDGPNIFQLKNLGTLRQYPYCSSYNLKLDDVDTESIILDEVMRFKSFGGQTIVENTTEGLSRNPQLLQKLSQLSGVNIICGAGFYVSATQQSSTLNWSVETIHNIILNELTVGLDLISPGDQGDKVKCGVIGEIGSSWPMHNFERNVIQAVAACQIESNAPITFHPPRHAESPFEIIRIFTEAGGKAEDVVMSHLDRTLFDEEQLLEFAKLKTFTQFDLFGTECSHYQRQAEVDMVSDAQRIQKLRLLKESGNLNQILISHDIHTKHRLANFGGHGYGHILQNIVPKMKTRGFSQDDMDKILIQNPRRWLTG